MRPIDIVCPRFYCKAETELFLSCWWPLYCTLVFLSHTSTFSELNATLWFGWFLIFEVEKSGIVKDKISFFPVSSCTTCIVVPYRLSKQVIARFVVFVTLLIEVSSLCITCSHPLDYLSFWLTKCALQMDAVQISTTPEGEIPQTSDPAQLYLTLCWPVSGATGWKIAFCDHTELIWRYTCVFRYRTIFSGLVQEYLTHARANKAVFSLAKTAWVNRTDSRDPADPAHLYGRKSSTKIHWKCKQYTKKSRHMKSHLWHRKRYNIRDEQY